MLINIESALVISRREIVKRGRGLEPDPKEAGPADSVFSFCMANLFHDFVKAPPELWNDLRQLGITR